MYCSNDDERGVGGGSQGGVEWRVTEKMTMEGNENENSRNVCSIKWWWLLQKQHLLNDYLQGTINLHVITNFFF